MDIKTIKRGQVFYACPQGDNYEYTAISNAYEYDGGYQVDVLTKTGEETKVYVRDGFHHYVRLYNSPQYLSRDINGNMDFVIS